MLRSHHRIHLFRLVFWPLLECHLFCFPFCAACSFRFAGNGNGRAALSSRREPNSSHLIRYLCGHMGAAPPALPHAHPHPIPSSSYTQ